MFSRRDFLRTSVLVAVLLEKNLLCFGSASEEVFPQGVASGDPTTDGIILWTRINPEVLKILKRDLVLQISESPEFKNAFTGKISYDKISAKDDFTVRIDLKGRLKPNTLYFYRFLYADIPSLTGKFKTLPLSTDKLSFATVVCQNYPDGYYTAFRYLFNEDIAFIIHLGDFIYEKIYGKPRVPERAIKLPSGSDICLDINDYRYLYRTYISDPDLKLARAMHPFIYTWDDHEFLNDYYYDYERKVWGYFTSHPYGKDREKILNLRKDAIKAWLEYIPSRVVFNLRDRDPLSWIRLYRAFSVGNLCDFLITDLRTYRDKQPCEGRFGVFGCPDQNRTSILGKDQRTWLLRKLANSKASWIILVSSVQFSQSLTDGKFGSLDAWDGYRKERDLLLRTIKDKGSKNLIVVSGDRHASLVAEIVDNYEMPKEVLGAEFMTPAISSINAREGGWWKRNWPQYSTLEDFQKAEMTQNPWIKHINSINCWGYTVVNISDKKVVTTIYSVDKYSKDSEKTIDGKFVYSQGKLISEIS